MLFRIRKAFYEMVKTHYERKLFDLKKSYIEAAMRNETTDGIRKEVGRKIAIYESIIKTLNDKIWYLNIVDC